MVPVLSTVPRKVTVSPFSSLPASTTLEPFTVICRWWLSRQSETRLASPIRRPLKSLLIFTVIVKGEIRGFVDTNVPDHVPLRSGAACWADAPTHRNKRMTARIRIGSFCHHGNKFLLRTRHRPSAQYLSRIPPAGLYSLFLVFPGGTASVCFRQLRSASPRRFSWTYIDVSTTLRIRPSKSPHPTGGAERAGRA